MMIIIWQWTKYNEDDDYYYEYNYDYHDYDDGSGPGTMKTMVKYDDYNYGSGPGFCNKFLCTPELKKLWFYMIMMNLALAWRLKKSLTAAPLS